MGDLPGCLVAITSMFTTKLERSDEVRTCGKHNFENEFFRDVFRDVFSAFRRNNNLLTKLEHQIFRETTVVINLRLWSVQSVLKVKYKFASSTSIAKSYTWQRVHM